jgi:hypothetical protein
MAPSDTPASPPTPAASSSAASPPHTEGAAASSSAKVTAGTARYVTRPTRLTLFLRTFLPWQLWRFARINLKMFRIIHRSRT